MMGNAWRLLLLGALVCVGVACWSLSPSAASTLEEGPAASSPEPPVSLELPFPGGPSGPEQSWVDEESRTKFHGLGRDAAVALAKQTFQIGRQSWMPPGVEDGGHIESYLGEDAAVEKLPGGSHVVVSSTIPLRASTGSGLAPVTLALSEGEDGYAPENPLVPVTISKHASGGVAFPGGLAVAPVTAAAAEPPEVVGDRVVFANAAPDTDLMLQPRPTGADISWQLRSEASPKDESVAFTLPEGARLQTSAAVPGAVEAVLAGKTMLSIPPAVAVDASGRTVPASYSIAGNVLTTHVDLGGSVDFPVLVDPAIWYGYYGTRNGASVWSGWTTATNAPSYFSFPAYYNLIQAGTNPGAPVGSYGQWNIRAPGPEGKPGSAGITRVDLTGVTHNPSGQSQLVGRIGNTNGAVPIYSWDGTKGSSGTAPLVDPNALANVAIAFCAQSDYGADGQFPPLCDEENWQGTSFQFMDEILTSQTVFNYVQMEGAQVTYRDPAAPNRVVLNRGGYAEQWLKTGPTNMVIEAEDEGLGIAHFELQIPAGASPTFKQDVNCNGFNGFTGCPSTASSQPIDLSGVHATGVLSLAPVAIDAANNLERPSASYVPLYLDQTAPVINFKDEPLPAGTLPMPFGGVIGDGNYYLGINAEDGSSGSPQSGAYSVEVKVDGRSAYSTHSTCPTPKGPPAVGCYALKAGWTMSGQAYGAGSHTVTVVAKDWAGNESTRSFTLTVNEAAYRPLGPGGVNLETGDYKVEAADASLSGGAASVSLGRVYDSRNTAQGASGPLGSQWALDMPGVGVGAEWQNLTPLPSGGLSLTDTHGNQVTFTPKAGGGYESPAGYQAETLTEPSTSPTTYQLTDATGNYTQFKQPSSGGPFVPSTVAQAASAGGLNKVNYSFTTTGDGFTEPTEVIAAEPSEGACTASLVKGCRALTFNYASSTTATGEGPTQWGDYKGRLTRAYATAWDPAKGEMTTTTVAQYAYDTRGRLRAEWDPRISPALKTTYGYDGEGHATAVSAPGQQPWLLTYGTVGGDANTGRLLAASRPTAGTPLWTGEALSNTVPPVLSGTAATGNKMSVTTGVWAGSALAYSYQWEDCNATGGECSPIGGATNASYAPTLSDEGHTIVAQVTATNAGGSATAATTASTVSAEAKPTYTSAFGAFGFESGQFYGPTDVARDANGNLWIVELSNARVDEYSEAGTFIKRFGTEGSGNGQFKSPYALAIDSTGNLWITDSGNKRVQEFNPKGEYVKTVGSAGSGSGQFESPVGIAIDQHSNIWVTDGGKDNRVEEFNEKGEFQKTFGSTGKNPGQLENPAGIAIDAHGHVWVTEFGNSRLSEFNEKGELLTNIGSLGTAAGQFKNPNGMTIDAQGHIWVADGYNQRVQQFNETGEYASNFGAKGTGPGQFGELFSTVGIATDTKHDLWIPDTNNNRIEKWTAPTVVEGATPPPPTARWTLEYHVPVSGSGAPYALGSKDTEAWRQKDNPSDATAIFPPDEPQTWPASDYRRASIFYMDSVNNTTNTAAPSGAISTTEYSSNNNVTRTLTADNRQVVLNSGLERSTKAETLSTENTYSSDGTELTGTLGPEHTVKLSNGSQVAARKHTQYFYDEGAPSGGPYRLVTKTIEGAKVGAEEQDARTVTTGYAGGVGGNSSITGWQLHTPTSTTTTVGSSTLTSKTVYDATTGNVTETRPPAAAGPAGPPIYASQFGSSGSGAGQLSHPAGTAFDASGNLWVADALNNRVDEFSASGTFIATYGWGVSTGAAEYQICKESCRAGTSGVGNGQFNEPWGIAINKTAGDVYVVDQGNGRVQEITTAGAFLRLISSKGTEAGKLTTPVGAAIDGSGNLWVADYGDNRVEKFSATGSFIGAYGSYGTGNVQFHWPSDIAVGGSNNAETIYVTDTGNNRIQELKPDGTYKGQFGSKGTGNGQFHEPEALAFDASENLYVLDSGNGRVQKLTSTGTFIASFSSPGSETGKLSWAQGLAIASTGDIYVADSGNNRIEKWTSPNATAHDTQTIYYTASPNSSIPACGSHPEWAGLACQAQPAAQPNTPGLPNLPVTTYTYNVWDEPTVTIDTSGSTTRTSTIGYDAAGRPLTSAISSTVGTPVPTVTNEYSATTGALVKQSTSTQSVVTAVNTLGEEIAYTDADGNQSTFTYDEDERLKETNDGKGTQTVTYDTTTGLPVALKDSAAGTFTATYDVEGAITSKGYPDGMSANYTLDSTGQPTALEYVKTTHCASGCTWYSDTVTPSIHGQWLTQTSSLSTQSYAYDQIGRLTQVQDTPAGKGCTTRLYSYDEDTNRLSLTTREPGAEGKCATEGGITSNNAFDSADRLAEPGVLYDAFGNTTSLPAADAGGTALTSSYYVNSALASQTQNGQTVAYNRDPDGRVRETVSTGTVNSTMISHYAGAGDSPAWTSTSAGWTRNITGIDGTLAAIQANGGTPELQLTSLHGDIIAKAALSETETKLLSSADTTEYGVPRTTTPPAYSWLGGSERRTELPSGMIGMGARGYVPQLGRFEQTDPQPGGSSNAYAYTNADPVNSADPSGNYTETVSYNYEAAATGSAQSGLAETGYAPGAIFPPPADLQLEEELNAHPPWTAPYIFTLTLGGGAGAYSASLFGKLKHLAGKITHWVGQTFGEAEQQLKLKASLIWDGVNTGLSQKAVQCAHGAADLTEKLDAVDLRGFPLLQVTIALFGCDGGLHDVDFGGG